MTTTVMVTTDWAVINLHNVVVGRVATKAEAVALADKLNAENPWVGHDTPRGRRMTEMVARRGGKVFIVIPPETLTDWAYVEMSR